MDGASGVKQRTIEVLSIRVVKVVVWHFCDADADAEFFFFFFLVLFFEMGIPHYALLTAI